MKRFIYADNAATTQLDMDAFEAMKPYLLGEYGNASQPYSFARTAKKALKTSRETIAQCIGAQPEEIFFTSGISLLIVLALWMSELCQNISILTLGWFPS